MDSIGEGVPYLIADFIEVWIHTILHGRHLYPKTSFERRSRFGIPVWVSLHPKVREYVGDIVRSSLGWLREGVLHRVMVVVTNEAKMPVERFVLHVAKMVNQDSRGGPPQKRQKIARAMGQRGGTREGAEEKEDISREEVVQNFLNARRAFQSFIVRTDAALESLPRSDDYQWTIAVQVNQDTAPSNGRWVEGSEEVKFQSSAWASIWRAAAGRRGQSECAQTQKEARKESEYLPMNLDEKPDSGQMSSLKTNECHPQVCVVPLRSSAVPELGVQLQVWMERLSAS